MATGIRRIAILRALKLGDLLCTVPAFRALRAAHPFAEIRLIGLPWAAELVRRYDRYLDGLFELPGFPGLPERPFDAHAFVRFLLQVHHWAPDLVLQLHGSGDLANPLAMLLGGRATAGFYRPGQLCPDPERFIPYPDQLPEVNRHLRLLEHLGIPARGTHKELPIFESDRRALAELLPWDLPWDLPWERGHPGRPDSATRPERPPARQAYAVIHPGASVPARQWPPARFAAVADQLAARGLRVVLTGSAGEQEVTAAVRRAMTAPSVDLAGRTDLGTLAALLADAALLVSNDTGVMHVGEAVGTPLVAVSFDPESWRWAPRDTERHRVLPGGLGVTVADLLTATSDLLCSRTGDSPEPRATVGQTSDGRLEPSGGG